MGSQLHLFIKLLMPSAYKITWLELVILLLRSPNFFSYGLDGRFIFKNFFLRVSICIILLKHIECTACTWFSELCAQILVRCKHYVYLYTIYITQFRLLLSCAINTNWCEARFRHALTAEMSETFPSGGSMHASVKLEGIDGRAPQERVEHVA